MKTRTSIKRPTQLLLLLFSVVAIVIYFIFSPGNDRHRDAAQNTPASESSMPSGAVHGTAAPTPKEAPAPLIAPPPYSSESNLSGQEEADTQSKDNPKDEISISPLQEPTEQQLEYQTLLEHKVNGSLYVDGPLLPAILNSQEFAALTKQQRNTIAQRIVERLNSGELRPEDVYP